MKKRTINWAIMLTPSGRMVVDAPPTGFRSTLNLKQSTRFSTEEEAKAFMKDRGIFSAMVIQVGSGNPLEGI